MYSFALTTVELRQHPGTRLAFQDRRPVSGRSAPGRIHEHESNDWKGTDLVRCNAIAGCERGAAFWPLADARAAERHWPILRRPTRASQANTTEAEHSGTRKVTHLNSAGGGTTRGKVIGREVARPNDSSTNTYRHRRTRPHTACAEFVVPSRELAIVV